jgi:SAM-dependent methyltransferase
MPLTPTFTPHSPAKAPPAAAPRAARERGGRNGADRAAAGDEARAGSTRVHAAPTPKWPKYVPPLTPQQQEISNDFMKYWHKLLPRHFSIVERFNHGYPVWHAPRNFRTTLEIGAGLGEHIIHEPLTEEQMRNYHTLELRENMSRAIQIRFPKVQAVTGDCQRRLEGFADGYFDRILAIHVLEHLPNLPAAIREAYRLCNKQRGVFSVLIPCEGSPAYTLARRLSAQRVFEKRYKQSYHWFISREHINRPHEILEELKPYFSTAQRSFFPLLLPATACNLCIGLTLRPRKDAPRV